MTEVQTGPANEEEALPRVERIGSFSAEQLSDFFHSLAPEEDRMILMFVKDGQFVFDKTDVGYLAERNRRRAEKAFAKGLAAGKADISKKKFREGYFLGYEEGKEGLACRDPDAETPEDSLTSCDFQCRLCVYVCPTCGHCTYYDRKKETNAPDGKQNLPDGDEAQTEKGKGRRKHA